MIWLLFWLQLKHFIVDFPLQFPRHYLNKGTWMHWGGIEHAGLHALATLTILLFFATWPFALLLALAEWIAHYLIDFSKMNVNRHYGLKPDNSEKFWWLLGFDQWLHQMCYLAIFAVVFR